MVAVLRRGRRFDRELLERYLSRLSRNGVVAIDPQEAWDNYRRFIAYGYWVWVRVPPAQQLAGYNIAVSERFGAAMADHHVFELLGVLTVATELSRERARR